MSYRMIPILLSVHDPKEPYHGGARATLGYLALASLLNNGKAIYIRVGSWRISETSTYTLTLQHYDKTLHIKCIEVPLLKSYTAKDSILNLYTQYLTKSIVNSLSKSKNEYALIIVGWRHFWPVTMSLRLSMLLTRKQRVMLVGIADALPGFYAREYISTHMKAVIPVAFGKLYYALIWRNIDVLIAISSDIEGKLKSLLYPNVIALRPLYVKIQSVSLTEGSEIGKHESMDMIVENVCDLSQKYRLIIFSSAPRDIIDVIAKKSSDCLFLTFQPLLDVRTPRSNNVVLIPKGIPDDILAKLYACVDLIWVHRKVMTGISMTILEALYYRKPVICNTTALRGYEDLMHTNAILPYNSLHDVSALIKLIDKYFTHIRWDSVRKVLSEETINRFMSMFKLRGYLS